MQTHQKRHAPTYTRLCTEVAAQMVHIILDSYGKLELSPEMQKHQQEFCSSTGDEESKFWELKNDMSERQKVVCILRARSRAKRLAEVADSRARLQASLSALWRQRRATMSCKSREFSQYVFVDPRSGKPILRSRFAQAMQGSVTERGGLAQRDTLVLK